MSLPGSTIEQLEAMFRLKQNDWIDACKEIDRLNIVIQNQRETIQNLELSALTMRRRLESLEADRTA